MVDASSPYGFWQMSRIELGGFSNGRAFPQVDRSAGSCCEGGVSVGVDVIRIDGGCRGLASAFVSATSSRRMRMRVGVCDVFL